MRRPLYLAFAVAALAACASTSANAPEAAAACQARGDVVRHLAMRYGEAVVGFGLSNTGMVMELLVSQAGTWTLISTDTQGLACLTDAGGHFHFRHPARGRPA